MTELTYRQRREITFRWEELLPLMTVHCQRFPLPQHELGMLRITHLAYVLTALQAGVSMRTIRRRFLDDPRRTEAQLKSEIADALMAGRKNPGRPKRKLLSLSQKRSNT